MKHPVRFIGFFLVYTILFLRPVPAQTPSGSSSWYGNRTEAGISLGFGKFKTNVVNNNQLSIKNNEIVFLIHTINGIKLQDRAFLGLGVGYELWQKGSFIPLFGYLSYDLQKKENPFVASVSLGYSFGTREAKTGTLDGINDYNSGKGGFMASIGLGYRLKISNKLKFVYEVFYKYQAIQSSYNTIVTDSVGKIKYNSSADYNLVNHFFGFRIGIVY